MNVHEFVERWSQSTLREQQAAQSHFNELCQIVGHKTPTELDPKGEFFTFEENVEKSTGGRGRADVWYKGHFAWEYKGKLKDLDAAYAQILSYRADLENPPLLVVSDFLEYRIYPQWTNTDAKPFVFHNEDLAKPDRKALRYIEWLLTDPDQFLAERQSELAERERITKNLAEEFAHLADLMRRHASTNQPQWTAAQIARFLTRILFLLFAEDIKLLPRIEAKTVFRYILDSAVDDQTVFVPEMQNLFETLDGRHKTYMARYLPYFNGSFFASAPDEGEHPEVLDITQIPGAIAVLRRASDADWEAVNPTIFGTMFEGALDPNKRAQLGAHYTSEADIRLVIEPVLMLPLNRKWDAVQAEAAPHLQIFLNLESTPKVRQAAYERLIPLHERMMNRLASTTVLDPACGSGNFLYMSLRLMKDLEGRVRKLFEPLGLPFRDVVTPRQFYGIEKDEFAANLAHVVIWIGYLQWRFENEGELHPKLPNKPATPYDLPSPILKDKDSDDEPDRILNADAIMRYDADGKPYEPEWIAADVIVGNPPFIGDKKMLRQLGKDYVKDLRNLYDPRVAGGANFVTYWFEKARRNIQDRMTGRAGLLATTSIRKGKSNLVLRAIKDSGDIFLGWSDHEWVLEGAQVRVAIVGFDDGTENFKTLDDQPIDRINADLTAEIDITQAKQLSENIGLACVGDQKGGAFDIPEQKALDLLSQNNASGASNADVVRMYYVSHDIANRWSRRWIIDFNDLLFEQASQYIEPMAVIEEKVKPSRLENEDKASREKWWLHQRARPELRAATQNLARFIATPRVAKHRLFVWLDSQVIPDSRILAIFRDDDFFFGVLHSAVHELWALRTASRHGIGDDPTYNQKECFEAYPFPVPPGHEDTESPHYQAISATARQLNEERELWLNPPDLVALGASAQLLRDRTLTNLYNALVAYREGKLSPSKENPAAAFAPRLAALHDALDRAVLAAYGWDDLTGKLRTPEGDEELLRRLLALNHIRAEKQQSG